MSFTPFRRLAVCALSLGLAACATSQEDSLRYQSTTKAKASTLATPPDVTQLMRGQSDAASARVASASDYRAARPQAADPSTAPEAMGDVHMESEGQHRWLVVGRTPEQLWEPLRKFWQDNGFVLDTDQPERRIMETDWAESHAKVPTGIVRDTIASLSSATELSQGAAEMDRFRTRLERVAGGTEIYVSHRGMREIADTSRDGHTTWRASPADAELEAEWLRRMMAQLGGAPNRTTTATAETPAAPKRGPQIIDPKGQPTLQLAENFDLAWRHVGLALDRTGFTVEDRNRSDGTYFVRYVPPSNGKEPGAFAKLVDFVHPGPVAAPLKLGIQVRSEDHMSAVTVVGRANTTVAPADALRIVQVIAADLQ